MATAEVAVVATRTLARGLPAAVGLDWTTRRGLLGLGLLNPSPSSLPSSPSRIHTWTAWGRATLHAPPVAPRAQGTTSGTFGEPQSSSQTRSLMGKVVQDATARASAAVGSACKAAAEATERMKEARERLARSHRAAYLWLPRPVRTSFPKQPP